MTDEQAEELGRRLVACEGFRWMPGMLVNGVLSEHGNPACDARLHDGHREWPWEITASGPCDWAWEAYEGSGALRYAWPDLRDPAMRGCVLELVRERWPLASVGPFAGIAPDLSAACRWRVTDGRGRDLIPWQRSATEAEALVAALAMAVLGPEAQHD